MSFNNRTELKTAVDLWIAGANASTNYQTSSYTDDGAIESSNVGNVTDMS